MTKLSVSLSGHQTSISLESEFINTLKKIAAADNLSIAAIVKQIDEGRAPDSNLSAAIRVYILRHLLKTAKL